MQYYAKTYTAEPKIGLITPGEFLTDEQAAILGEEKITDMVARGVLGVTSGKAAAQTPAESEEPVAPVMDANEDADTAAEAKENEAAEDGELPELDAAGEISEEEPAAKPAKKAGRRKTAK